MRTYITKTSTNTYKYRRKVPVQLQDFIHKKEILKSLGKNHQQAVSKAQEYSQLITQAIDVVSLEAISTELKNELVLQKLSSFMKLHKHIEKKQSDTYLDVAEAYISSLTVSDNEIRDRTYILLQVFPVLLQQVFSSSNPRIEDIKYSDIISMREILQLMPKRNIEKYRTMSLTDIISSIVAKKMIIEQTSRISITTINKYLKWFSTLIRFAQQQNMITLNPITTSISIRKNVSTRSQRKEFTKVELELIEQEIKHHPLYPIQQILRYTGMRTSELAKCKITKVDNILCFDLRDPYKPLKTLSSYRVIPIHNKLIQYIESFQDVYNSYSPKYISKYFTKIISRVLEDTEYKSLYSLRHSFATSLIANGVSSDIVSELMGHAHQSMTLNRYTKGYPVSLLQSSINSLQ